MEALLTKTRKKAIAVGIREFRDNLAAYLLESVTPVTITRHGETVGIYIPVRRKRSGADWGAMGEAHDALQKEMARVGVTQDEIIEDFNQGSSRMSSADCLTLDANVLLRAMFVVRMLHRIERYKDNVIFPVSDICFE